MNEEEMMRIMNQVAAQSEQDANRAEVESYINVVSTRVCHWMLSESKDAAFRMPEPTQAHLKAWHKTNGARIAIQVEQVVRMLLECELLNEK